MSCIFTLGKFNLFHIELIIRIIFIYLSVTKKTDIYSNNNTSEYSQTKYHVLNIIILPK